MIVAHPGRYTPAPLVEPVAAPHLEREIRVAPLVVALHLSSLVPVYICHPPSPLRALDFSLSVTPYPCLSQIYCTYTRQSIEAPWRSTHSLRQVVVIHA